VPPVEIVPGLLRWTAPHPDWRANAAPGSSSDWERDVGSVLYEASSAASDAAAADAAAADTVVLIDPLLPSDDRGAFLDWLDERVAGRAVSILTTIRWHRRDREELAERYAANTPRAWNFVPRAVKPEPLRGAGETMYWLADVATLVPGDRLLGAHGGGLRVCPQSWLSQVHVNRPGLVELLRALVELPIERVLVSHGEPVLHRGRAALVRALGEARAEEGAG
jgi:hypothetical protein